jgi:hypothetical protein
MWVNSTDRQQHLCRQCAASFEAFMAGQALLNPPGGVSL